MSKVIVDADACPYKNEIITISRQYNKEVLFVFNTSHISDYPEDVKILMVDPDKESADLAIVNLTRANDLVVTQDYGLAAMVLAKSAKVLLQNGMMVDDSNIDQLLNFRHVSAKNRKNRVRMKGSKKLTEQDRVFFCRQFENEVKGCC